MSLTPKLIIPIMATLFLAFITPLQVENCVKYLLRLDCQKPRGDYSRIMKIYGVSVWYAIEMINNQRQSQNRSLVYFSEYGTRVTQIWPRPKSDPVEELKIKKNVVEAGVCFLTKPKSVLYFIVHLASRLTISETLQIF